METKANTSRISKYFNLPSLNQTEQQLHLKEQDALYTATQPLVNPAYIFGIEVEVEQVPHPKINAFSASYWNITVDNSLRNSGAEFVSLPLKAIQLEGALTQLTNSLPPGCEFSPRTSVHVHMNVRDLSIEQITNLLVLYTTVEDVLFKWVGHERDKSVFCIKLTETNYVQTFLDLHRDPRESVGNWNKYTAFNIHPMESKGTVEFRHLEGTIDIPRILTWVNFLSCLKRIAKQSTLTQLLHNISELNTSSMYETFVRDIFQEYTHDLLQNVVNLQALMEDSVSYVKLATIQRDLPQTTPKPAPVHIDHGPYAPHMGYNPWEQVQTDRIFNNTLQATTRINQQALAQLQAQQRAADRARILTQHNTTLGRE